MAPPTVACCVARWCAALVIQIAPCTTNGCGFSMNGEAWVWPLVRFIFSIILYALEGVRMTSWPCPAAAYFPAGLSCGFSTENIFAGAGHAENIGFVLLTALATVSHRKRIMYLPRATPVPYVPNDLRPRWLPCAALSSSPPHGTPPGVMKVLQVHNFYQQAGGEDQVVAAEHSALTDMAHSSCNIPCITIPLLRSLPPL